MKIAIIGVGNMGKKHLRVYSEIQEVDSIFVADIDEKNRLEAASKYNVPSYKDYKEMIKKEKPDAVSVCVPTVLHYQVVNDCIKMGVKHLLLEKPITLNTKEGEKLLLCAKKYNVNLMIGHIERFNPAVIHVKKMIHEGELGKIIAIMFRRIGGFPPQIKDVNIAVDLAIHDIDIANYLLDELPSKIMVNKQKNHIKKREDSVEFFLKYKKASAYIQANWISPVKIRKLNITGTEGYLEMDFINQKIEFYKSNYDKFKETIGNFSDYMLRFAEPDIISIAIAKKEPLVEEISYFLYCVKNKIKTNSLYALQALRIATHTEN